MREPGYKEPNRRLPPKKQVNKSSRSLQNSYCKYNYGITLVQKEQMYEDQDYRCKLCGIHEDSCWRGLCIDHDHITGKVRGLLCHNCNLALGYAKDSPELLEKMAKYLR